MKESDIYSLRYYVKFQVSSFHTVGVTLWTKRPLWINKGHLLKYEVEIYAFYALHFYTVSSIYLQSFLLIPVVVSELCSRQNSKCQVEQIAITPKLGKANLRFLITALLLNEIYLHVPTKFHVDTPGSLGVTSGYVGLTKCTVTPQKGHYL